MNVKKAMIVLVCTALLAELLLFALIPFKEQMALADTCEATFYSSASDGYLYYVTGGYDTVHDCPSGTVQSSGRLLIGQDAPGSAKAIYRAGLFFDTSSLPDSAEITSATLSLYGYSDASNTDFNITVVDGTVLNDPLQTSDYGNLLSQTTSGGAFNTSGFSIVAYNDIPLNTVGIGWISKTGTTKLGLRSERDITDTEPFGPEYVTVNACEQGEGYWPRLVVSYECTPVGGDIYSITRLAVLAPWLGLAAFMAVAMGVIVLMKRRHVA
ncbi:MAG TPA: hypothetical protein VMX96_10210 [Dehalococcoidia bacterium]|nr:hypothetical protein [Dehalococcoidia bacterium]